MKQVKIQETKVLARVQYYIPEGSTSLASLIASDVAISWLAGEIANIMQLGYTKHITLSKTIKINSKACFQPKDDGLSTKISGIKTKQIKN